MVRTSHVFVGIVLVACIAATAGGAPTVQDFDTPGTAYTLWTEWGDAARVVTPPAT
jgi:hypothetical protein